MTSCWRASPSTGVSDDAVADPGGAPDDEEVDAIVGELLGDDLKVGVDTGGGDGRLRLSFTRVDTFERCPRRYRYQYVDGLPQAPAPQLSFGSSIHAVLEWLYDRKHPVLPSLEETLQTLYTSWDTAGYAEEEREVQLEAYAHARAVITSFHGRVEREGFRLPAATEAWFELPIGDDIVVVGAIDRVDVDEDGALHVVDYKTNRKARTRAQVRTSLQLAIYALATEHLYGRLPSSVALDFVVPGVLVRVPLEELDLTGVPARLRAVAERIRAGEDTPVPHRLCDWCDFQSICPAWTGPNGAAEDDEVLGRAMRERDRLRRLLVREAGRLRQLEAAVVRLSDQVGSERDA
jgi:putative RecB family exonuclease